MAAAGLGAASVLALALLYRHAAASHPASQGQGFPLDDAWIHAQFALNATLGRPFQFNPGTLSSGCTAPLWSLALALCLALFGDPVVAAQLLGVACSMATVVLCVLLARRLGLEGPALLSVPLLLAPQWRLAWASLSGMEIPLASALLAAGFWLYLGERQLARPAWRSGLVAGLLVWTRPEGALMLMVLLLDQLLLALRSRDERQGPGWPRARRAAGLVAAWAAVTVPLFCFNAVVGPGIFPQTAYAKAHPMPWNSGWAMVWTFVTDLTDGSLAWQLLLVGGAGYAVARSLVAWRADRGLVPIGLLVAAAFAAIAFLRGSSDYYDRYLMPFLPLLLLLGAEGLVLACRALGLGPSGALAGALALSLLTVSQVRQGAETYALNVASVSGHVVALGRWLDRHVPQEATLAMSDIGAMSYFTRNRVIDMRGLISPSFGWDRPEELDRQRRERVDYAILFPELNDRVILGGRYVPIHAVTLDANNVSATDNLVVYRTPWADPRVLRPVGRSYDFEDGTLQGWEAAGVLANGPVEGAGLGQRRVIDLGGGRYLLSSWGAQGDVDLGRALSPEFPLEGDVLTLRIGGGQLPGRVGVRLWVGGRIARTATGDRSEVLVQREWDVRALRGQLARLELLDESQEGWGHVMLDEVRQYRVESGEGPGLAGWPAEGPQEPRESRRAAEAAGLRLDPVD